MQITYDSFAEVAPGEALVTKAGRTYVIVGARRQSSGKHVGRWHLQCVVADSGPPPGVRVHLLIWHSRDRRA